MRATRQARPGSRRWTAWGARLLAPLATIAAMAPAHAGSIDVGAVRVSPDEGGSTTAFTLEPPAGAACPGDSADDGYRVQSYMVPASVDPTSIAYDGTGPIPYVYGRYDDFRQPLYDVDSNSFVSAQTADADPPGQPGPIINIPSFDFAVFGAGQLPAGRYHIGLACTLLNDVALVWDTEIVVAEDPGDEPAQIRWTVVGAVEDPTGTDPPVGIVAAAVAIAAIVAVVLLTRRRARSTTTTSLEDA